MKVLCLSLEQRSDLRENQEDVHNHFGDDFDFFLCKKNVNSIEDIDNLIRSGLIGINFNGGRKQISSLINEMDCFVNHYNALKSVTEPTIIYEDGTDFDIELYKQATFDKDILFCAKSWKMENNKLVGHGTNYYVTPEGAQKLISLIKNACNPYDLYIRNILNENPNVVSFGVVNKPFISRNSNVSHTIQNYYNPDDVNNKQCWRPLIERLYTLKKQKFAIIASHPTLGTGYANMATQIANNMLKYFDVIYLGFQSITGTVENRELNDQIRVYDLYKLDPNSPGGFGDKAILPVLEKEKPDIVMIYNDIGVVSSVLKLIKNYSCLKTTYLDMVYEFQDYNSTEFIMNEADYIFTFCDFWKQYLDFVYEKPNKTFTMMHGIKTFPKDTLLPRDHFGYAPDDFVFLNMNRNSNRKNLDKCIRGFLILLNTLLKANEDYSKVFLQLNCHLCTKDGFHIPNIVKSEIKRMGLPLSFSKQVLITSTGHSLSEIEAHSLYNACDVGVSVTSGEGFGLTTIEHALYDKPIVASYIPTTRELLDTPYLIQPSDTRYDCGSIGGLMYEFKGEDVALQLYEAYKNRKEPVVCKIKNLEKLDWSNIVDTFYNTIN